MGDKSKGEASTKVKIKFHSNAISSADDRYVELEEIQDIITS